LPGGELRGVPVRWPAICGALGATGIAVGIATAAPMAKEVSQAGNIDAEDLMFRPQQPQGGAREQGLAAYGMPVRRIDRYCQHLHQDFTGVRRRLADLRHPTRLRRPVLVIDERFMTGPSGFR